VRRAIAIALAGIAAVLLQTTVLPALVPAWMAPNLLLVLVIYLGVHHCGAWGAAGAFALGYALDTFSGTVLGVHAFAFTLVYLGVHQVAGVLWTEGGVAAVLMVLLAGVAHAVMALALASLVSGRVVWTAWGVGMLQTVAAAVVTLPVFRLLAWEQRMIGVT
jgi:rod shape-determining protein MreD